MCYCSDLDMPELVAITEKHERKIGKNGTSTMKVIHHEYNAQPIFVGQDAPDDKEHVNGKNLVRFYTASMTELFMSGFSPHGRAFRQPDCGAPKQALLFITE